MGGGDKVYWVGKQRWRAEEAVPLSLLLDLLRI